MKWFDRILVISLALGVWALVFKSDNISAHHSGENVSCSVGGYATGELDDTKVSGIRLRDSSVTIDSFSGLRIECTID